MHVIGTAGHVDHGKSSLVLALTGIDPDRLAEEKAREMTIDLGFAWLDLPGGETVGIVDVPGHRDFIDNMLAGIGGIDLVLFVIAADEGVMPQTREHLAIIDLLEIPHGVIALTKIDMISDPDWLDMIRGDIATFLAGTTLQDAPIIPVSARTGEGLDQLVHGLQGALDASTPRPDRGCPRMPIDRVFTMKGFGTVVTGTLDGGTFSVGDEAEIVPRSLFARVRGLQSHRQGIETAQPGSRVAINLSGINPDEIRRGDVIAQRGSLSGTELIDVRFKHPSASGLMLHHNDTVRFFSGAAETSAQVRLLGSQESRPGSEGFLQLRLAEPIALGKGDRFILRWPSPAETIGGGVILDAHPAHRWRRFKPEVLARLEALARDTPEDTLLDLLQAYPAARWEEIVVRSGLHADVAGKSLASLIDAGRVIALQDGWWITRTRRDQLAAVLQREMAAYHAEHPLRAGMSREALRSRSGTEIQVFNQIMAWACEEGLLAENGTLVRLPNHQVRFSDRQQTAIDKLYAQIAENPAAPPGMKEAAALIGDDVLAALLERGQMVQVGPDVWFDKGTYDRLVEEVRAFVAEQGSITVAQARDLFNTSRKYATALLEHLDATGVTMRNGDAHVLRPRR